MKEKRAVVRSRARIKGKSDWARVTSMSEKEIMRAAKSDPDAQPTDLQFWQFWKDARIVLPAGKHPVTLRLDRDVLDWFKAQGRRYQSRMNAVLRSYMEGHRKTG